MKKVAIVLAGLVTAGSSAVAMERIKAFVAPTPPPVPQMAAPLIERAKLFGNPTKAAGQISPDGQWLGWIAPRDGVMNIWVAPMADLTAAKALTAEKTRPIRSFNWTPDSTAILYINDKGGDENFLLYGVDVNSGEDRLLTPFEKTRVLIIAASETVKDRILVGLNNRDPRWHDIHSLNLKTGKLTPVLINTGNYGRAWADGALNLKLISRTRADGGTDFFKVIRNKVDETPAYKVDYADSALTSPLGFTTDGKTLYWQDTRGRDTAALFAMDFASGKTTLVAERADSDIASTMMNPKTGRIEAYQANYLKPEWVAVDAAVKADVEFLNASFPDGWFVSSRTEADDAWTVSSLPSSASPVMYLYGRAGKKLTELYKTRPELEGAPLVPLQALEIKSRDGLTQVSYLTLPPGSDADNNAKPDKPVPMVLLVHGGPWARDSYGFNRSHQWLANRGYAVLSPNFRGSTGFGKGYIAAGDKAWGTTMHDDLIDAVEWAIAGGITTRDKVAIMGGSYGGYATLAGLTFTPDAFACGVDIVGPSNLNTLLKSIPAYWESERVQLYARVGDPTTEDGQKLLTERSPLFKADAIKKPLLIGQGANDPRVKQAESDQIVAAMKAKNIPVTYVLFPDEGHGFARPQNNMAFNAVAEEFLKSCLGGRSEPLGDVLKASTAQIQGAEYMPALGAALKTP